MKTRNGTGRDALVRAFGHAYHDVAAENAAVFTQRLLSLDFWLVLKVHPGANRRKRIIDNSLSKLAVFFNRFRDNSYSYILFSLSLMISPSSSLWTLFLLLSTDPLLFSSLTPLNNLPVAIRSDDVFHDVAELRELLQDVRNSGRGKPKDRHLMPDVNWSDHDD